MPFVDSKKWRVGSCMNIFIRGMRFFTSFILSKTLSEVEGHFFKRTNVGVWLFFLS